MKKHTTEITAAERAHSCPQQPNAPPICIFCALFFLSTLLRTGISALRLGRCTAALCSIMAAIAFAPLDSFARGNEGGYVVHEWGTFTSVQGSDGVPLRWRPLESSALPKFVYDWQRPGLQRSLPVQMLLRKDLISALQRMETPVIYFYADKPQSVDVSVDFPKGRITEWYPQAAQIGPAVSADPVHRDASLEQSSARWSQVELLPQKQNSSLAGALPLDSLGTHYFAARETDAAYLRIPSLDSARTAHEIEKFIFYRGTGDFATPLRVSTGPGNSVVVAATGSEPLAHVFVLEVNQRTGGFLQIKRLKPGEQRTIDLAANDLAVPVEQLSGQLASSMTAALVTQGLYPREAAAMVKTWKDSWFAEEGVRVLYILPRTWTDSTLPLRLTPPPKELVRVMVGRAEVLTPALQHRLSGAITRANSGDAGARALVLSELKSLGRFAEPAISLAVVGADAETTQTAWRLYQTASKPIKASEFE